MKPNVAPVDPINCAAGAFDNDHALDTRASLQCFICISLERYRAAAPETLISGDNTIAVAIVDTVSERIGRETTEHNGVDCANTRAGQHGISRFGDHRHIDRDPVALGNALGLQYIGHAADLAVQLAIGDQFRIVRIVTFPDNRGLVAARLEMAVYAVGANIDLAAPKPTNIGVSSKL